MSNKKYKLLKDLPYAKKGAIYNVDNNGNYVTMDVIDNPIVNHDTLHKHTVENNPEWFELITEPSIQPEVVALPFLCESEKESEGSYARFSIQGPITNEQYESVRTAINNVLNDTVEGNSIPEGEKYIVGEDMICPITKKHCDDECCPVGAECNLSGNDIEDCKIQQPEANDKPFVWDTETVIKIVAMAHKEGYGTLSGGVFNAANYVQAFIGQKGKEVFDTYLNSLQQSPTNVQRKDENDKGYYDGLE